jgi:hypothetical protein
VRKLINALRVLIAGGVLFAGMAISAPAQAETNPYTPVEVCGSSYHVIDYQGINGGIVYLLWNGSYNCVATIKTYRVGTATWTGANLQVEGDATIYTENGYFKYYAGPVKRPAAGKCVRWGGFTFLAGYRSGWEHCG